MNGVGFGIALAVCLAHSVAHAADCNQPCRATVAGAGATALPPESDEYARIVARATPDNHRATNGRINKLIREASTPLLDAYLRAIAETPDAALCKLSEKVRPQVHLAPFVPYLWRGVSGNSLPQLATFALGLPIAQFEGEDVADLNRATATNELQSARKHFEGMPLTARQALFPNFEFLFGKLPAKRIAPYATGKRTHFAWSTGETLSYGNQNFRNYATPVGAYGETFARQLVETGQILGQIAEASLVEESRRLIARHRTLFSVETARTRQAVEMAAMAAETGELPADHVDVMESPIVMLHEALLSMNQAIALLAAEQVPGMADGTEIVRKLLLPSAGQIDGTLVHFTRGLAAGVVGPAAISGTFFPEPLTHRDGRLELSENFQRIHKAMKENYLEILASNKSTMHRSPTGRLTQAAGGLGCPFAFTSRHGEPSGIQKLADAFHRVFQIVAGRR